MLRRSCSLLITQLSDGPELANTTGYHTVQGDEQAWEKVLDEANSVESECSRP